MDVWLTYKECLNGMKHNVLMQNYCKGVRLNIGVDNKKIRHIHHKLNFHLLKYKNISI